LNKWSIYPLEIRDFCLQVLVLRFAIPMPFLTFVSPGEALGVAGVFLAIVGIILSARSLTRARLAYQHRGLTLIGQPEATTYGDIKILFNGEPVPRLVVTRLAFWNAGNTTVRRADLVEKDPLTVCFEEKATILGSRILSETTAVNECILSLNRDFPSRAFLTFDYLNRGDGAVFEIIHTGSIGRLNIGGSVRGIPKGVENWGYLSDWDSQGPSRLQAAAFSAIIAGPIILAVILDWLQKTLAPRHAAIASVIGYVLVGLVSAIAALFISAILFAVISTASSRWRRLPKSLSRDSVG